MRGVGRVSKLLPARVRSMCRGGAYDDARFKKFVREENDRVREVVAGMVRDSSEAERKANAALLGLSVLGGVCVLMNLSDEFANAVAHLLRLKSTSHTVNVQAGGGASGRGQGQPGPPGPRGPPGSVDQAELSRAIGLQLGKLAEQAEKAAERKLEVSRQMQRERTKAEAEAQEKQAQAEQRRRAEDARAAERARAAAAVAHKQQLERAAEHAKSERRAVSEHQRRKAEQAREAEQAALMAQRQLAEERKREREQAARELMTSQQRLHQDKRQREEEAIKNEARLGAAKREAEAKLAAQREKQAVEQERKLLELRQEAESRMAAERERRETSVAVAQAKAKAEAEAEAERQNEQVRARARAQAGGIESDRAVRVASTVLSSIGSGVQGLLADTERLSRLVAATGALVVVGFTAREGAKLARGLLAATLGRPGLVRETSRLVWTKPVQSLRQLQQRLARTASLDRAFSEVVLNPPLRARMQGIAEATKNTRANGAPFRHTCFYGPPGTGKTMLAKKLAYYSGLDYAIMSGGDVGPLGSGAVTEIHKLFEWARWQPSPAASQQLAGIRVTGSCCLWTKRRRF